jgi:hypothetical protein
MGSCCCLQIVVDNSSDVCGRSAFGAAVGNPTGAFWGGGRTGPRARTTRVGTDTTSAAKGATDRWVWVLFCYVLRMLSHHVQWA